MTSLRRDIHSAFEVIEPPLGGMPERVVQTVLADKRRQRKERMVYRLRFSFALVAAGLVVAVAAAALMTWNSLHQNNLSPAGSAQPVTVQQLEARTVRLPTATSASSCPQHPGTNALGYQFGSGPVYVDGGPETSTDWGYYYGVTYFAPQSLSGPILVRGQDLMSPGNPVVFVGQHAAGTVVATDSAPNTGTLHNELVLDPSHPQFKGKVNVGSSQIGFWSIRQGIWKGFVGCVGFQIDGPDFTETITTFAAP